MHLLFVQSKYFKMKMLKNISLFSLLVLLAFSSCRKDEDNPVIIDETVITPPNIIVNADVLGTVFDQAGDAVSNATVTMGVHSTLTDENGAFIFSNKSVNQYGQYIKVEKNGYFLNSKFVEPGLNERALVKFEMIQRSLTSTFSSSAGGVVSFGGAEVNFSANSIVDEAGIAYSGAVNIYATRFNPEENILDQIPGDLRAISGGNEIVQLETYGMIAVELEGDSGQRLNIAEGQSATVTMPIPEGQLSNAPDEIPLWYMDETTGYWMEEGTATKQGDQYVGQVTHFSFWNCDYPYPLVQLSGTVTFNINDTLGWATVRVTINGTGISAYAYLDENGFFTGKVPKDEPLTLEVLNNCGDVVHTENLGALTMDTTVPTIDVNISQSSIVNVFGNLVKCDLTPVTNGYAVVGGSYPQFYPVDANGSFSTSLLSCNPIITVKGFDLDETKASEEMTHDLSGLTELDLGNIDVCDDIVEYIQYTLEGEDFTILDPFLSYGVETPSYFILTGNGIDSSIVEIYINNVFDAGTFNPDYSAFTGWVDFTDWYSAVCQGCDDFDFTIDAINPVGELMTGSFDGTMQVNGVDGTPVSGSFKAYRDE